MVMVFETENDIEGVVMKDMLTANGIACSCERIPTGTKNIHYISKIWVNESDVQTARDLIDSDSEFSDIPWDPDSDCVSSEPTYPWYLDKKIRFRIARIFLWVMIGFFAVFFIWLNMK